ncbi:plasmid stabilization system protein ParE [Rhizobium rosettiformans]|uniref:Plasmid stabilization system protein ParE n=1 Tax=Rhizobium rosettiformans TaxID=1368430 RepID=A0A7W8MEU8_9HYPH|nr:type II toxin-antitoxin system RelE/ParE family toxin [Rhizobium rosettiformans]MBB5277664.1 plasmid stabilization system protein ParE [Rhizobium rosettiformans]
MLGRTGTVSGTRELPVHGLLYTIIYRIVSTAQLDIVTILHQRMLYPLMEG